MCCVYTRSLLILYMAVRKIRICTICLELDAKKAENSLARQLFVYQDAEILHMYKQRRAPPQSLRQIDLEKLHRLLPGLLVTFSQAEQEPPGILRQLPALRTVLIPENHVVQGDSQAFGNLNHGLQGHSAVAAFDIRVVFLRLSDLLRHPLPGQPQSLPAAADPPAGRNSIVQLFSLCHASPPLSSAFSFCRVS